MGTSYKIPKKIQVQGLASLTYVLRQKTRMNDLSCRISMWTKLSFVLSQSTRLTDRKTDRKASQYHASHVQSLGKNARNFCITLSANKFCIHSY